MIGQQSRIKSKQQNLQFRSPRMCLLTLLVGLCVLALSIYSVQTATCPASVPVSAATTKEQCTFTEFSSTESDGIVVGPVSNSLYYLYFVAPLGTVVRKVNVSGSQTWVASFAFSPITKSLTVDATEQSVYFASFENPVVVIKLAASTGAIVSQHIFTGIIGNISYDVKIWSASDLSAYFFIGYDSSVNAKLCKYTFSSSLAQCQTVSNIQFGFAPLMISNGQFFVLGAAPFSPKHLNMYKITFSLTSVSWANQIVCTGTCSSAESESRLSSDGSKIYSFFLFGSTKYLYFVGLSVADGSVATTRYKSSASVYRVYGSALNGDYAIATTFLPNSVVIYSISSSTFTIKAFFGTYILGCGVETSSNKFVVVGLNSGKGYITKFDAQSISSNSDFSAAAWSMAALSAGTDDIVSQSGVTIATPNAAFTPAAGAYVNQTATYSLFSFSSSDAYLKTETESFSVFELTNSLLNPSLSCSFSGSTSITFSLSSYNGGIFPSFVSINSTTGVLSVTAPGVSSSTTYTFYIDSTVTGLSGSAKKIINLTVNKCSGSCNSQESQMLTTINQVVIGAIVLICVASRFTNLSSMASLWIVINQLQLLFYLFLTGVFIPEIIKDIITGLTICINPFSYFQIKFNGDRNFVSNFFNFGLENSNLEVFEIKSDSTIVNLTSFFFSIIINCILHFCIFLTQKILPKESKSNFLNRVLLFIHSTLQKLMVLYTFTLYIRIILETNQFILISSVSEIYHFDISETKRIISISVAFLVFIGCVALIIGMILFAFSKDADKFSEHSEKRSKFANLFEGISLNKKSRLFACLLLIRRAIFVILLITIEPKSSIVVISILVGLQLIYFVILVTIRPYCETNCNIIDITNELYFLVILPSLLKYNTVDNWEGTPTTAYAWLILSNSFINLLLILVDSSLKVIIKCRNKCCKNSSKQVQTNSVQPFFSGRLDNSAQDIHPLNIQTNKVNPKVNIQRRTEMTIHRIENSVKAQK